MNELMKLKVEREIWPQCISNVTTDTGKVMKFDKYKFAELIVKECCDQVRMVDAMEIKKHFGVEG